MNLQRVSIAMCTYNGAENVLAQLQSFATQTKLPDELVICDDASTDATVEIVRKFILDAPFPVHLLVNEWNLGFASNFAQALNKCSGDIIFLSDQDDVWMPEKLQEFVDVFSKNPTVGLVFCDALLVDAHLTSLGQTWGQSRHFGKRHQKALTGVNGGSIILKDPTWMAAGATMAFRAVHRACVEPIPAGWTHDAWIATVVSAYSQVALIPEPLNQYRQHAMQVYGASASSNAKKSQALARGASSDHFNATVMRYQQLQDRLASCGRSISAEKFSRLVQMKLTHWRSRLEIRQCSLLRQSWLILQELVSLRYLRYSQGWKSCALDVWSGVLSLGVRR